MLSPSLNKDFTYLLAYLPIYSWKTYSIITIDFSNFFFWFDLILYAPVNNFSVMAGWVYLDCTSTNARIKVSKLNDSASIITLDWSNSNEFFRNTRLSNHWKFNGFNTEVGPNLDPKCLIMDDLFLQPVNNFSVMSGWVFCVEPVPISLRLKCLVPLLISCWHWSCPSLAIIRQANQFVRTCSLFITSRNDGLGIQYWNRVLMAKKDVICSTLAETILSS